MNSTRAALMITLTCCLASLIGCSKQAPAPASSPAPTAETPVVKPMPEAAPAVDAPVTTDTNPPSTPAAAEPPLSTEPNRRAVEWVLRIGGRAVVEIHGEGKHVTKPDEIPATDFKTLRSTHRTSPSRKRTWYTSAAYQICASCGCPIRRSATVCSNGSRTRRIWGRSNSIRRP